MMTSFSNNCSETAFVKSFLKMPDLDQLLDADADQQVKQFRRNDNHKYGERLIISIRPKL